MFGSYAKLKPFVNLFCHSTRKLKYFWYFVLHSIKENTYLCGIKEILETKLKKIAQNMKKTLIILILTTMSFSSMAMGFPHSTFSQQRTLLNKGKKVELAQKIKQVEAKIVSKVEEEKSSLTESFVQGVYNFFIKIFNSQFSSHKSVAVNDEIKSSCKQLQIHGEVENLDSLVNS
jgi:hypothetical protein